MAGWDRAEGRWSIIGRRGNCWVNATGQAGFPLPTNWIPSHNIAPSRVARNELQPLKHGASSQRLNVKSFSYSFKKAPLNKICLSLHVYIIIIFFKAKKWWAPNSGQQLPVGKGAKRSWEKRARTGIIYLQRPHPWVGWVGVRWGCSLCDTDRQMDTPNKRGHGPVMLLTYFIVNHTFILCFTLTYILYESYLIINY